MWRQSLKSVFWVLQGWIQGTRAGFTMPSSRQIAGYNCSFVTMVAIRTGSGTDRKQIKQAFIVAVEQKGRWFFAVNDRFLELRMVLVDYQAMRALTPKGSTVA